MRESFDMNLAIASWRTRLTATGRLTRSDIEELESHLRDHVDALAEVGIDGEDAFHTAEKRLGEVNALALEYGKVNTMLAWRDPVQWMAVGCLATFIGTPALLALVDLVLLVTARYEIPPALVTGSTWALAIGGPVLFFAGLLVWPHIMSRWLGRGGQLLDRAPVRVTLLTLLGAAGLFVFAVHYPINAALWRSGEYWLRPANQAAMEALSTVDYYLGVGVPVVLCALTLLFRWRSARSGRPSNWGFALLGAFAAIVGQELSFTLMTASALGGVSAGLGDNALSVVVWGSTLLLPSILFGCAHAWLHKTAPSPERVLRSRVFLITVLAAGAVGFVGMHWGGIPNVHLRQAITNRMFIDVLKNWNQARMVATGIAPITIGFVVLRARHAAQRYLAS